MADVGDVIQHEVNEFCSMNAVGDFHGRDLFAPVAAKLAKGEMPLGNNLILRDYLRTDWPEDLNLVIYIDRFGNVISGVRAATLHSSNMIEIDNHVIQHANTFSDVPQGQGF